MLAKFKTKLFQTYVRKMHQQKVQIQQKYFDAKLY